MTIADIHYYQTCASNELKKFQEAVLLVKQDGLKIAEIDQNLLTEELCLWAVQQNAEAFAAIPDKIKDQVNFLKVVLLHHDGKLLQYVDHTKFSATEYEAICFNAIVVNNDNLKYVKNESVRLHFESLLNYSIVDI